VAARQALDLLLVNRGLVAEVEGLQLRIPLKLTVESDRN
jgi:hypothetical protein